MASFLEKFASVSAIEYCKCSDMQEGKKYPIISLVNTETKYGKSVLATVQHYEDVTRTYRVYLPKRYAGMFTDEELRHITPRSLHLEYRGKRGQTTIVEITQ